MQELQRQIVQQVSPVIPELTDSMSEAMVHRYMDAYEHATYLNESVSGNQVSWANYNEDAVKMAVSKPWQGGDFSQRIWGTMGNQFPEMLVSNLVQGLILGENPRKIAKRVAATNKQLQESNLHRLIQTEMAHVTEEATFKSYQDTDVEWYEYMATLESRTCETCGHMDMEHYKVSEKVSGANYPPIHPYCRCTTAAWFEGMPEVGKRWSKDPTTGKKKMVDGISFDEWKNGYDLLTKQDHVAEPKVAASVPVPKNIQAYTSQAAEHVIASNPFLKRAFNGNKLNLIYDETTFFGRSNIIGATSRSEDKTIHLNPAHYQSETLLKKYMESGKEDFVNIKPSQYRKYPIIHEMGHIFHNELWNQYQQRNPDSIISREKFIADETRKIYTIYEKQTGKTVKPSLLPSVYATKNDSEAFAELFTLANIGRPSQWRTAMNTYLKGVNQSDAGT
ncbi:minor capsid protein [Lacticaseibacillus hulanensis]|uniref:minor capsid protein n=1 Tax=Lacticaseibacillus hulanensis TaxID=2493111 RepID=UPI000FDA789A|nr:minor capsid protein [Lacticaseibacillus hulanensis]